MGGERNGGSGPDSPPRLDAILREAAAGDEGGGFPFDEMDLLDYLHGEADEATARRIRHALASSAALRRELREISADLDVLEDPRTQAEWRETEAVEPPERAGFLPDADPWAEQRERARARSRAAGPGWLDRLRLLFLQPAFAAAFVFLLMAYPTARYFLGGSEDRPLLTSAPAHNLDAGDAPLRGGEEAPLPRIRIPTGTSVVHLSLWSEDPYPAKSRYAIEIRDAGGVVWRTDDFPVCIDLEDPYHLDFNLDSGRLRAGPITIAVTAYDRENVAVVEQIHRFELISEGEGG